MCPEIPEYIVEEIFNRGANRHQIAPNAVDCNQPQQSFEGN